MGHAASTRDKCGAGLVRALGWDFCCPQHCGAAECGLGWELLGLGNYLLLAVGAEGGLCCTTQLFAAPLLKHFFAPCARTPCLETGVIAFFLLANVGATQRSSFVPQ